MRKKFPHKFQSNPYNCGYTCLEIIAMFYENVVDTICSNDDFSYKYKAINILELVEISNLFGLQSLPVSLSFKQIKTAPLPLIIHWNENHFIVLYKIDDYWFYASDPARGLVYYSTSEFINGWLSNNKAQENKGICILTDRLC